MLSLSANRVGMACILGLDGGTVRIGVSRASNGAMAIAAPLCTVKRTGVRDDVARLAKIGQEQGAVAVVVGLPYDLDGNEGRSARLARQVGDALGAATGLPVYYQDERFSTVEASHRLHAGGRSARDQRGVIDQAAAAVILQDWLDRPERGDLR